MDIWFMSDETPAINGGAGDKVKIKHLEEEISGHESDKHAMSSIAARASELETKVLRLRHARANAKISEFESSKDVEKEEKMNVNENERNLLLEKLKESEERFREFETEKARKIEVLMNQISEFEAKERENEEKIHKLMEKLKESEERFREFETEKTRKIEVLVNRISEFEAKERENSEKIDTLMEKLKESEVNERVKSDKIAALMREKANKDDKIAELTFKNMKVNEMEKKLDQLQKEILSKENAVESTTTSNNGIVSKVDWPVVAVSAGAVATLGLVYFRHAKF